MSDGLRLGGGVLIATPGSSARQTRGKGTLKGLAQGFQKTLRAPKPPPWSNQYDAHEPAARNSDMSPWPWLCGCA